MPRVVSMLFPYGESLRVSNVGTGECQGYLIGYRLQGLSLEPKDMFLEDFMILLLHNWILIYTTMFGFGT